MVAAARAALLGHRWIVGDMRRVPLPVGKVDGIVSWHALFHLSPQDQVKMLRRVCWTLRPGGVFLFTAGNRPGVRYGAFGGEAIYHASLAPRVMRRHLLALGFRILRVVLRDRTCGGATVWLVQR